MSLQKPLEMARLLSNSTCMSDEQLSELILICLNIAYFSLQTDAWLCYGIESSCGWY